MTAMTGVLSRLEATIRERRSGDPDSSYVAKLTARGRPKIAQKLGEEAVETVIAALSGDAKAVTSEAADLVFHLAVLLAAWAPGVFAQWNELAFVDPSLGWRTLETRHFEVHFPDRQRAQARAVAGAAERILPGLTALLRWQPRARILPQRAEEEGKDRPQGLHREKRVTAARRDR